MKMSLTKKGYKNTDDQRNKVVAFRVSKKEYEFMKNLAEKHTRGNISDMFRYLITNWNKKIKKIEVA